MSDNLKSGNPTDAPPSYQAFPQPGQPQAAFTPSEPPPKYEPAGYQQGGAYPPQGTYPVQGGYQQTTVYPGQPGTVILTSQPGFGQINKVMQCQFCHAQITTSMEYETGAITWLSAGLICVFGCWLGCCLIPFCINDLQDVKHKCPNCNKVVGIYRRM